MPTGAIQVIDADEETFDLYSTLSLLSKDAPTNASNLGMVDGKTDVLTVALTIEPPVRAAQSASESAPPKKSTGRSVKAGRKTKTAVDQPIELEVLIGQDMQRLRASGGDTGSVVWRSSLHLMSFLLSQLHFPHLVSSPLLSPTDLADACVLELGSGTGLLAIALAPFVGRWVCTDQAECLKLIGSNLTRNGLTVGSTDKDEEGPRERADGHAVKGSAAATTSGPASTKQGVRVGVEELDWFLFLQTSSTTPHVASDPPLYDLIVSSDCIYNPHLVPPLLATFAHFAEPNYTIVLVVIELRQADVIQEFLELWLEEGDGRWEIRRLVDNDDDPVGSGWGAGGGRFAGWVGWRTR